MRGGCGPPGVESIAMELVRHRRTIATAVAITAVGLLAGCGSSGDSAESSSAATTAASGFVARANAICSAATEEFNALGNTQEYADLADFKDRFGKAMAIAAQQYEDIATLDPPADIARDVRAYLEEGAASVMMTKDLYDRVHRLAQKAGVAIDASVFEPVRMRVAS